MMIFAAQAKPNIVPASHTFAMFARVSDDQNTPKIDTTTISWMPADLKIDVLDRDPKPGKNMNIPDALQWAQSVNSQVSMWVGAVPDPQGSVQPRRQAVGTAQ
jgi:hypothetical protein